MKVFSHKPQLSRDLGVAATLLPLDVATLAVDVATLAVDTLGSVDTTTSTSGSGEACSSDALVVSNVVAFDDEIITSDTPDVRTEDTEVDIKLLLSDVCDVSSFVDVLCLEVDGTEVVNIDGTEVVEVVVNSRVGDVEVILSDGTVTGFNSTGKDEGMTGNDICLTGKDVGMIGRDVCLNGDDVCVIGNDVCLIDDNCVIGKDACLNGHDVCVIGKDVCTDDCVIGKDVCLSGDDVCVTGKEVCVSIF